MRMDMRTDTLRISSCLLAAALAAGGSTIALPQARRSPGDPSLRGMRARLVQARADRGWPPQRVQEARDHTAIARNLIARGDLDMADRELDRAESQAPGLPEVIQTRAYFQRVRYGN